MNVRTLDMNISYKWTCQLHRKLELVSEPKVIKKKANVFHAEVLGFHLYHSVHEFKESDLSLCGFDADEKHALTTSGTPYDA